MVVLNQNKGGLVALSQLKKVLITMPDYLLDEIDALAKKERKNRSEMVREVMKVYIKQQQANYLANTLATGYQEMAKINLELVQMYFIAECENHQCCEEKLSECE